LDIHYSDDPAIAKLLDEYGSIWKKLDPVVADVYASIQRKVNDRNKPEANKYRALLADAFNQAVELRGGGSKSVQLNTFAPAHEEWIIAHFGSAKSNNVSDEEFVSRLTMGLSVGVSPQHSDVQRVGVKFAPRSMDAPGPHSLVIVAAETGTRNIFDRIDGRVGADDRLPEESVIRSARVLFLDQYGMAGNLRAALIARAAGIPIVADFEEHHDPRFQELLGPAKQHPDRCHMLFD
jgi:hypothetical protein